MAVAVSAPIMAPIGIPSLTATSAPATETPTSSARSSVRNLSLGTGQWISPLARHFRRRGEHVEQRLQGITLRQPVYQRDHTPGGSFPQLRLDEIGELLPQLLVGDGVLRSAGSMPDVFGARLTAIERDGGLCLGLSQRTVLDHQDAVAQLLHVGTVDLLVGELLVAGGPFYPGDSTGESDAELALQPRTGSRLLVNSITSGCTPSSIHSTSPAGAPVERASALTASIAGWVTTPQEYGLMPTRKVSHLSPSASESSSG